MVCCPEGALSSAAGDRRGWGEPHHLGRGCARPGLPRLLSVSLQRSKTACWEDGAQSACPPQLQRLSVSGPPWRPLQSGGAYRPGLLSRQHGSVPSSSWDASVAEAWLTVQEPTSSQLGLWTHGGLAEKLLKRHEAFEKSAASWEERFAALEKPTTVSQGGGPRAVDSLGSLPVKSS